jgi:hypothetical protein
MYSCVVWCPRYYLWHINFGFKSMLATFCISAYVSVTIWLGFRSVLLTTPFGYHEMSILIVVFSWLGKSSILVIVCFFFPMNDDYIEETWLVYHLNWIVEEIIKRSYHALSVLCIFACMFFLIKGVCLLQLGLYIASLDRLIDANICVSCWVVMLLLGAGAHEWVLFRIWSPSRQ